MAARAKARSIAKKGAHKKGAAANPWADVEVKAPPHRPKQQPGWDSTVPAAASEATSEAVEASEAQVTRGPPPRSADGLAQHRKREHQGGWPEVEVRANPRPALAAPSAAAAAVAAAYPAELASSRIPVHVDDVSRGNSYRPAPSARIDHSAPSARHQLGSALSVPQELPEHISLASLSHGQKAAAWASAAAEPAQEPDEAKWGVMPSASRAAQQAEAFAPMASAAPLFVRHPRASGRSTVSESSPGGNEGSHSDAADGDANVAYQPYLA